MISIQCKVCDKEFQVIPARAATARTCSNACAGKWRATFQGGSGHPGWKGGKDQRKCVACQADFSVTPANPQKFCTKACADQHGYRNKGADHPNYREGARRRNRGDGHARWARLVITRDKATCQRCGAQGVELQAHHIKPYAEYPELRLDLDNGLTLCAPCHWNEHAASNANGVNSGELSAGHAGDNPEPSLGRKLLEGVTTNGRAYRRWNGECDWCKCFISKRLSDTTGKAHLFCSKVCSGKYAAANRSYRRWRNPDQPHGSNADTSALPERDDIV